MELQDRTALVMLVLAVGCMAWAGWMAYGREWIWAAGLVLGSLYFAFTGLRLLGLVQMAPVDEEAP